MQNTKNNKQFTNSGKVLLVGGAGYIGLVIAKQLSERGMQVIILDNMIYKHNLGLHSIFYNSNIEFLIEIYEMT